MRDASTHFRKLGCGFVADSAHYFDHVAAWWHRDFVTATGIKVVLGSSGSTLGHCTDCSCRHELFARIRFNYSYLGRHRLPSGCVREPALDYRPRRGVATLGVQGTKERARSED